MTDSAFMSGDADGAFMALAADLVEELSSARALELTMTAPPVPRPGKVLPAIAQDKRWCAYCGASAKSHKLTPGPDADWLGDQADHFCADEKACIARNRARHGEQEPPEPAPEAPESQLQPAPVPPEPQQDDQGWRTPEGWVSTANGSWTARGDWLPPLPVYQAYAHTLMNPVHRSHLLSGQQRPHYYAGQNYIPPGMLSGAEPAQEAPGGQQGTDVPPGGELARRGMYEAARGQGDGGGADVQMQRPELPEAAPQRPARRSRSRRTRWR